MSEHLHNHNHGISDHDIAQILKQSKKIEDFEKISDILGKMSDPKRAQIFWILCHCEECVADLAEITGMSSPAVSHHLKVLKECGLIESRRDGKEVCYRAADSPLSMLMHTVTEEIMAVSCPDAEIHRDLTQHKCGHKHHSGDAFDHDHDDHNCEGHRHDCAEHNHNCHDQSHPSNLATEIHDYLEANLDKHITIESLSKHFAVNPTTIKTVFKNTYGNSIAAHMKEHRMEKAAGLLKSTDSSVAEIAKAVGFRTQSKFTQAFKETYHILPKDYRNA